MSNPSVTNVDGTNYGPNVSVLPDTVQMPTGNIWKIGVFSWSPSSVTLTPVSVASSTAAEQTFAATGIGLLTTDFVYVSVAPSALGAGGAIGGARVSAADTLAINYVNATPAAYTPTSTGVYTIFVARVQPNWTVPSSGNLLDW